MGKLEVELGVWEELGDIAGVWLLNRLRKQKIV